MSRISLNRSNVINIAQLHAASRRKIASMPSTTLYWWKAAKCMRMAKNAIAPHTRADYEAQAKAWRKIAELLELQETGQKNHLRCDRRSHFTW